MSRFSGGGEVGPGNGNGRRSLCSTGRGREFNLFNDLEVWMWIHCDDEASAKSLGHMIQKLFLFILLAFNPPHKDLYFRGD